MKLRGEQVAILRSHYFSETLIKDSAGSKYVASREPLTGDVLVRDPNGNHTKLGFDNRGFVGTVSSPLGRTTTMENDHDGKLLGVTNPAGLRAGMTYDSAGKLAVVSRESQDLYHLSYDDESRLEKVEYYDKTSTTFRYGESNQVSSITDRLGATEEYTHNLSGNLVSITDANHNRTTFDYSIWDRPDRVRYADGKVESYGYDASGLLNRIAVGQERIADIRYDGQGNPVEIAYGDGEVLRFEYDSKGNVLRAANSEAIATFEYDDEGRVVSERVGGSLIKYEYDENGALVSLAYPSGEKVEFDYDADLRLERVKDWNQQIHHFTYSGDDRKIKLESPNGLTTEISKLATGLPSSIAISREGAGSGNLLSFKYQYDLEDRVQVFTDSEFGVLKYSYDSESRLVQVWANQADRREDFSYDATGNRLRSNHGEAVFNVLNQLTSQGDARCTYDDRGNTSSFSGASGDWRFKYNSRNLLVRAEDRSGRVVSFGYDAFGRRMWKRSGGTTVRYVWAGEQLVSETRDDGSRKSVQEYIYLPASYTPLATRIDGTIYYYHTDHLGTPRRVTDGQGNIVWSANFSAYGEARVNANRINNPLRFQGHYFDEETGLHYNRFRYYAPWLGRYLSRDPLTYLNGLNFYCYSNNDPINTCDPMGLWSWKTVVSVVAAVAVAVAVTAVVIAAAPVALAAVGVASAAIAAGTIGGAAVTAAAVVAGGVAAGAVGYGLNEGLEHGFTAKCFSEAGRGAIVGGLAALPFAALPLLPFVAPITLAAATGVGAYTVAGAASGAIGYSADVATSPKAKWNWLDFGEAVAIGAATGGIGRYLSPRISRWWKAQRQESIPGRNATFGPESENHVNTHGHAADGQAQTVDPIATKKAGEVRFKSKFAPGEGGQPFTDEVLNDPNTQSKTDPKTGRTTYKNDDLGRVTGSGQKGEPVSGGTVVVEGPNPHAKSTTPPGNVVTQFPSGNKATGPPVPPVPFPSTEKDH